MKGNYGKYALILYASSKFHTARTCRVSM